MSNERAKQLLKKYREGKCTPEEQALMERLLDEMDEQERMEIPEAQLLTMQHKIWQRLDDGMQHSTGWWQQPAWRVAAAILLCIGLTSIYVFTRQPKQVVPVAQLQVIRDVAPGGNKAVLTLGDGSKINLSDAKNGKLTGLNNITKTNDGEVMYTASATDNSSVTVYNTISTPKGGQYQVILPDGSKVWLNAASSLKFPTSFTSSSRKVELTGEGYFEVTHHPDRPFLVSTIKQTVEVLGTHFNVNAYADEPSVRTTLLEGKVKVHSGNTEKILLPGQQVINSSAELLLQPADLEVAMAWRNGGLRFKDQDLPSVMREVARWYDVTVTFEGQPGNKTYTGYVSRSSNLSSFLKILELSNIQFKLVKESSTGAAKLIIL